jgi:hypothetical protein
MWKVTVKLCSFFNTDAIWGCVDNAIPRLLHPQKLPGIRCTGSWVSPKGDLDSCGKFDPFGV